MPFVTVRFGQFNFKVAQNVIFTFWLTCLYQNFEMHVSTKKLHAPVYGFTLFLNVSRRFKLVLAGERSILSLNVHFQLILVVTVFWGRGCKIGEPKRESKIRGVWDSGWFYPELWV